MNTLKEAIPDLRLSPALTYPQLTGPKLIGGMAPPQDYAGRERAKPEMASKKYTKELALSTPGCCWREVRLMPDQLAVSADGVWLGFILRRKFIVATSIRATLHTNRVSVGYDLRTLPAGVDRIDPNMVPFEQQRDRVVWPRLTRHCCEVPLICAWIANAVLFVTVLFWLLVHIQLLPRDQADSLVAESGIDGAVVLSRFWRTFAMSLVETLIALDGVKVLLLTVTSDPALELLLPHGTWRQKLLVKPMRRMHLLFDSFLE